MSMSQCMVIYMAQTKVVGTVNTDNLKKVLKQIAFEIYVLQAENKTEKRGDLYEAVWVSW